MNETRQHYTAWLTTDPKLGLSEFAEVDVLEDELIGEDPDSDANWATKPGGEVALASAATTVRKEDGDDREMRAAAWDLLDDKGWRLTGEWLQTDHGFIVTVERES